MKRSNFVLLALLLVLTPTPAETVENGLPATGSIIPLHSTPHGYEAHVIVSPQQQYVTITGTSSTIKQDLIVTTVLSALQTTDRIPVVREIDIAVNTPNLVQGQYDLTLTVTPKGRTAFEQPIWIQVPAVTIDPPQTLVIRRHLWSPEWSTATSPQIWESSRHAGLTGVTVMQKGDTDAGGEPAGTLAFNKRAIAVEPGASARLKLGRDFTLDGDFPLGTAKGMLILQADQLATPVPFAFEVHSTIPTGYLLLALALGLGLGSLARKGLNNIFTASQQRQEAFALIAQIDRSVRVNKDGKFQADAAAARDLAVAAANGRDAATIGSGCKTAKDAFTAANDDLAARRNPLLLKTENLKGITSHSWHVPRAVMDCLTSIGTDLPVIGAATDIASTDRAVDVLLERLRVAVSAACASVYVQAEKFAAVGPTLTKLASNAETAQFAQRLNDAKDAVMAADPGVPPASLDQIKTALAALQSNLRKIEEATDDYTNAVEKQVKQWLNRLALRTMPAPAAWKNATDAVLVFCRRLRDAAANPDNSGDDFDDAGRLPDIIQRALILQFPQGAEEAAINACKRGELSQTVDWLVQNLATPTSVEERPTVVKEILPHPLPEMLDIGGRLPLFSPPEFHLVKAYTAEFPEVEEARERLKARLSGAGIYSIYAAIIVSGGYFLFETKWVGQPIDFATAFFWAFAIDVGADAASSVIQGVLKK